MTLDAFNLLRLGERQLRYVMELIHRECLRKNWIFLIENVQMDELLDYMYSKSVFTSDMCERVNAETTRKDKVTLFLFTLQRRGPRAFSSFLDGLEDTSQSFISDKLTQTVNELSMDKNQKQPQPMQV